MKPLCSWLKMAPMVAVMGAIFFLSHQPASELDFIGFPFADKIAHFLMYGLLALTAIFAFSGDGKTGDGLFFFSRIVLLCLFYGVSDEYHQSFINGRDASGGDLFADVLGAAAACFVWYKLQLMKGK